MELRSVLLLMAMCLWPSSGVQYHVGYTRRTSVLMMSEMSFAPAIMPAASKKRKKLPRIEDLELERATLENMAEAASLLVTSFFERSALNPAVHAITAHREHSRLREHHGGEEHLQIVVRLKGEMIAFVDVDGRPKGDPEINPRPYISDLAVRPDYRRAGIGTHLILHCEDIVSRLWGKEVVYLKVETDNAKALRLYANLGYELFAHDQIQGKATLRKILSRSDDPSLESLDEPTSHFSERRRSWSAFVDDLVRRQDSSSPRKNASNTSSSSSDLEKVTTKDYQSTTLPPSSTRTISVR